MSKIDILDFAIRNNDVNTIGDILLNCDILLEMPQLASKVCNSGKKDLLELVWNLCDHSNEIYYSLFVNVLKDNFEFLDKICKEIINFDKFINFVLNGKAKKTDDIENALIYILNKYHKSCDKYYMYLRVFKLSAICGTKCVNIIDELFVKCDDCDCDGEFWSLAGDFLIGCEVQIIKKIMKYSYFTKKMVDEKIKYDIREGKTCIKFIMELCKYDLDLVKIGMYRCKNDSEYCELIKKLLHFASSTRNDEFLIFLYLTYKDIYNINEIIIEYVLSHCNAKMLISIIDIGIFDNFEKLQNETFIKICQMINRLNSHYYKLIIGGNTEKELCQVVRNLLKRYNNIDVNCQNNEYITIFHNACLNNNIELVTFLLDEANVDINVKTKFGWSGLHYAVKSSSTEIVKILVERNIGVFLSNEKKETIYNHLLDYFYFEKVSSENIKLYIKIIKKLKWKNMYLIREFSKSKIMLAFGIWNVMINTGTFL